MSDDPEIKVGLEDVAADDELLLDRLTKKDEEIQALKESLAQKDLEIQRLQALLDLEKAKNGHEASLAATAGKPDAASKPAAGNKVIAVAAPMVVGAQMLIPRRDSKQQSWEYRFQQLQSFKLKNGHCEVTFKDDSSLHHWVRKMRYLKTQMDQGKNSEGLTPARKELLDGVGFAWFLGHKSKDKQWEGNFQQLVEYKSMHGHTCVPSSVPKLGKWVMNQRARKRLLDKLGEGRCKGLTWARVAKLDAIGFEWDAPRMRSSHREQLPPPPLPPPPPPPPPQPQPIAPQPQMPPVGPTNTVML